MIIRYYSVGSEKPSFSVTNWYGISAHSFRYAKPSKTELLGSISVILLDDPLASPHSVLENRATHPLHVLINEAGK